MKKSTTHILKALAICFVFVMMAGGAKGQTTRIASVSGNWNTAGTWGATGIPAAGDNIEINDGITVTISQALTYTIASDRTLTIKGTGKIHFLNFISTLTINGTIRFNGTNGNAITCVGGSGGTTKAIVINSGATLITANINGLYAASGSIQVATGGWRPSINTGVNYEFNGATQNLIGITSPASTLTLSGTGTKTLASSLTVTNALTTTVANPATDFVTLSLSSTLTAGSVQNNANGTITMVTGGSLSTTTLTNSGTINASVGTINVSGNLNNTNAINITSTTTSAGSLIVGSLQNDSPGLITLTTNGTNIGTLTVSGNLNNASTITMTSGGTLNVGGNFNLGTFNAGIGTVVFTGGSQTIPTYTYNNLTLLGGPKTWESPITITGNYVYSSSSISGNPNISFTGENTQSIDGFSTTGNVTVDKTGGTATFIGNVSAGSLTNTLGTLNLGLARTHTISGTWTRTAGTLDGGSSTLRLGTDVSGTGGTFTAGTGTVEYYGAAQTIAPLTYNNLTLSGSDLKTSTGISVSGILSLEGTATVSAVPTYGNSATLQYKTTNARTNGVEWPASFPGSGGVVINSTGAITLDASSTYTLPKLTISAGNLTIPPTGKLTVDNDLTNSAGATGLKLISDATGAGSLIIKGTVSGQATVERSMESILFHLVSPPVTNQSIPSFFTTNTATVSSQLIGGELLRAMRDYTPASDSWNEFFIDGGPTATTGNLINGKGYSLRLKAISGSINKVTFTGTPVAGNTPVTISGLIADKWNCIGNPYTSAVTIYSTDANNFITENSNQLSDPFKAVYVWDPTIGATGAYSVINNTSDLKQVVQGQGFMVKLKPLMNSVAFTTAMQTHLPGNALKSTDGVWPTIELKATADTINSSITLIAFKEGMTAGLDPGYDAGFLTANNSLEINTNLVEDYGIPFALQALPTIANETVVVPVNVNYAKGGQVTFSATTKYLSSDYSVSLEDRQSNTFTPLTTQSYSAELTENTSAAGRFFLHISNSTSGIGSQKEQALFKAWTSAANELTIQGSVSNGATVSLLDVQGRLVVTHVLSEGNSHRISLPSVRPGIYLLRVTDHNKVQAMKVVINN